MPETIAALTLFLFTGMVMVRVFVLKRQGINAMHFGNLDKTDFLIPPFPLFYFYLIFANAFSLPTVTKHKFFQSEIIQWVGVCLCLAGVLLVLWSIISFGRSFRVGIDVVHPGELVTTGAFAVSRNPIYTAFALILVGQFLVFPNWLLLVYVFAGVWLFHRQVLREEEYLKQHYGQAFLDYCQKVGRYI